MNGACTRRVGEMAWNSAVASARPVNVPARRRTPRLNVVVKSGLSTMATVIGPQYARCQPMLRASASAITTQTARRRAWRKAAESSVRLARSTAKTPARRRLQGWAASRRSNSRTPGRAGVRGEFHGGGELSGERVELPAGVGARGGELGRVVAGQRRAQPLGEFAEFAQALGMRVAFDACVERVADGVQHAGGKLAGAIEQGRIGAGAGLASDADVQAAQRQQRQANALRLAEQRQVALRLHGAGGIEPGQRGARRQNRFGSGAALRWRARRRPRCAPVRRRAAASARLSGR